jgi:hypothetical protein
MDTWGHDLEVLTSRSRQPIRFGALCRAWDVRRPEADSQSVHHAQTRGWTSSQRLGNSMM